MKTKPQSPEYRAFENLLGQVLTVSKTELNRRIAEEKADRETSKGNGKTLERSRPIVSPGLVSSSTLPMSWLVKYIYAFISI